IDTAVYIQEKLAELNIDVNVEQFEWGAYLDRTAQGDHDMFILGWTTVTADADYGLYALFHSNSHGATGTVLSIRTRKSTAYLTKDVQNLRKMQGLKHTAMPSRS